MNKKINFRITLSMSIVLLLLSSLTTFGRGRSTEVINVSNNLITADSAGGIKLGMTVSEARKAMKDAKFDRTTSEYGMVLINVGDGNETYMTLFAGEREESKPIDENARIESIEVWHSQFKTAAGVHTEMKLLDAEKKYGKVKIISRAETLEFVQFTNQPKNLSFSIAAPEKDFAGIYKVGNEAVTQMFSPDTFIMSISLSSESE